MIISYNIVIIVNIVKIPQKAMIQVLCSLLTDPRINVYGQALRYFFKCIFFPFLALFSSGTPIMQTSGHLILPQRFLKSIFLFKIFSFLSPGGWFPVLSSWLLTHSSVASNLLLTPSVYFISCTAFFSSHWVFLYFLSLSLISHYVPPFFSWVQGAS